MTSITASELFSSSIFLREKISQEGITRHFEELKKLVDKVDAFSFSNTSRMSLLKDKAMQGDAESLREISSLFLSECSFSDALRHLKLDEWNPLGEKAAACSRIVKCIKNREISLDLANYGLTSLPRTIWEYLPHLECLKCSGNLIAVLPSQIERCKKLKKLECAGNLLTELPFEIGNLTQLTVLKCSINRITALPEGLFQKCTQEPIPIFEEFDF